MPSVDQATAGLPETRRNAILFPPPQQFPAAVPHPMKTPYSLLIALSLILSGCRPTLPPQSEQLREQFGVELPAYWRTGGFTLESSEVTGSAHDRFRGRFKAIVSLTTPTYIEDHWDGDVLFIQQIGRVGIRKTVYGRVESTLANRGWNTRFLLENDPTRPLGTPKDFFNASRVIVVGSNEAVAYADERRRQQESAREAAEATARVEQQRLEQLLMGEWHGAVFTESDSRLVVQRGDSGLFAQLFHQGYMETLRVEALAGGRFLLTGLDVMKLDGGKVNYNLDTFDVAVAADGTLTGSARDRGNATGAISMRKVIGED